MPELELDFQYVAPGLKLEFYKSLQNYVTGEEGDELLKLINHRDHYQPFQQMRFSYNSRL